MTNQLALTINGQRRMIELPEGARIELYMVNDDGVPVLTNTGAGVTVGGDLVLAHRITVVGNTGGLGHPKGGEVSGHTHFDCWPNDPLGRGRAFQQYVHFEDGMMIERRHFIGPLEGGGNARHDARNRHLRAGSEMRADQNGDVVESMLLAGDAAFGIGVDNAGNLVVRINGADFRVPLYSLVPDAPKIPGDTNGDGVVDIKDLLQVLAGWDQVSAEEMQAIAARFAETSDLRRAKSKENLVVTRLEDIPLDDEPDDEAQGLAVVEGTGE